MIRRPRSIVHEPNPTTLVQFHLRVLPTFRETSTHVFKLTSGQSKPNSSADKKVVPRRPSLYLQHSWNAIRANPSENGGRSKTPRQQSGHPIFTATCLLSTGNFARHEDQDQPTLHCRPVENTFDVGPLVGYNQAQDNPEVVDTRILQTVAASSTQPAHIILSTHHPSTCWIPTHLESWIVFAVGQCM